MAVVRDADFYSSLGSNYEDAYGHDEGLIKFLEKALTYLPPQSQVLDIGCGTGRPVASTLAAAGHIMTGIDISEVMLELSRKAVPSGHFQNADMRQYEPPAGFHFNAVLSIMATFILDREEIEEMVTCWSRWLPVGGTLCVATVAAEDYELETRGGKYDEDGRCARDIGIRFMGAIVKTTLMTRIGWEKLLGENGFEILDAMTDVFVPRKEVDSDEQSHYYVIARKAR
jgi:SAM-dependent methyltransferase